MKTGAGFNLLIVAIILVVGYVLIGSPNENAFARVHMGASEAAVVSLMGRPTHVESRKPFLADADYEYEYYLWPLSTVWCIGFKAGAVVEKGVVERD